MILLSAMRGALVPFSKRSYLSVLPSCSSQCLELDSNRYGIMSALWLWTATDHRA